MKRTISALALSGTIALMGAAGATAAEYPAPAPSVSVSDGTVVPGEAFTFSGTGFTPGEEIDITATNEGSTQAAGGSTGAGRAGAAVGQKIALPTIVTQVVTTANQDGSFSESISLSETGTFTLTALGRESGVTRTATITVTEAPISATGTEANVAGGGNPLNNLANTGAPLLLWSAIGVGALGAGAASVIAVRRKASNEVA